VFGRVDYVTFVVAAAVHAALALATLRGEKAPAPPRPASSPVVLQFTPRPPAPEPAPAPPETAPAAPAARARPTVARRAPRRSAPAPVPAAPAEAPAPAPASQAAAAPRPVFGVTMSSTTEVAAPGAVALAAGDLGGSPSGSSHAARTGASPGAPGPTTGAEIGSLPSVDGDACGRAARYPRDAEENGIEGDVRLRVSLNERGAVSAVRVLSGPGHGLEEAAAEALRHRCKFSPAIGKNGQALAFVIESYTFHFELPR